MITGSNVIPRVEFKGRTAYTRLGRTGAKQDKTASVPTGYSKSTSTVLGTIKLHQNGERRSAAHHSPLTVERLKIMNNP